MKYNPIVRGKERSEKAMGQTIKRDLQINDQ